LSEAPPIDLGTKRNESSRVHRFVNKRLTEVSFEPHQPGSASGKLVGSKGACHDAHHLRPAHGKARYDHPAREAPVLAAFDWINRLASEATSARRLADSLDQAILSKAFRGELVPQDSNDEPASMLG
jgi:hypothetical protein